MTENPNTSQNTEADLVEGHRIKSPLSTAARLAVLEAAFRVYLSKSVENHSATNSALEILGEPDQV